MQKRERSNCCGTWLNLTRDNIARTTPPHGNGNDHDHDEQESVLLATVDKELAQLALNHQTEVNELRKT